MAFATFIFSMPGKFGLAAEGKLQGIGPLKLGISRHEVLQTFGAPKPGTEGFYEKKIKLLSSSFDLLILATDRVNGYLLTSRANNHNAETCLFHSAQIKATLEKSYVGKPDVVGPGNNFDIRLQRNWWVFDDGEVTMDVNLSGSEAANVPGNTCTTSILIRRYNPELYKFTVTPQ
jgi:hypothetical protein